MKMTEDIKPITYMKTHSSELIKTVRENKRPVVITQNGEARAVLQDIREFEKTQESLAMLKILALSRKNIEERKYRPVKEVFQSIRKTIRELKGK